jgi:hypothetical protein
MNSMPTFMNISSCNIKYRCSQLWSYQSRKACWSVTCKPTCYGESAINHWSVGFQVFTAVTTKKCRLLWCGASPPPPQSLQGYNQAFSAPNCSQSVSYCLTLFLAGVISSALKTDVTLPSETRVLTRPTRCHIPEDGVLRSHCRQNLKSYNIYLVFTLFIKVRDLFSLKIF